MIRCIHHINDINDVDMFIFMEVTIFQSRWYLCVPPALKGVKLFKEVDFNIDNHKSSGAPRKSQDDDFYYLLNESDVQKKKKITEQLITIQRVLSNHVLSFIAAIT